MKGILFNMIVKCSDSRALVWNSFCQEESSGVLPAQDPFWSFFVLFLLLGFTLFMPIRLVEIAAGELKACKVAWVYTISDIHNFLYSDSVASNPFFIMENSIEIS